MKMKYKFRDDGSVEILGDVPSGLKVHGVTRRFSEILPTHPALRLLFKLLRLVFSERGPIADWTRSWSCEWEARILMGNLRGTRRTHQSRATLIAWEQEVWAYTNINERSL